WTKNSLGKRIAQLQIAPGISMPINVTTQHTDAARTGTYPEEKLNWWNVNVNSFGKLGEHTTEGFIWAQPLFVSSVETRDRGARNLVIVATSQNFVYAFDADNPNGGVDALVWRYRAGPSV